jgi:hypothetical protein
MTGPLASATEYGGRTFDRVHQPDARNFPVATRLASMEISTPHSNFWRAAPALDQGALGACVGFGISGELAAIPVPQRGVTDAWATQLYYTAQRHDGQPGGEWPGAEPQRAGSSVLAGMKAATALGAYDSYHWASSELELALAVGHLGPAVLGVTWYADMMTPDENDYLSVSGDPVGGHCILCIGINVEHNFYTLHNSWGTGWGFGGDAKISRTDMRILLQEQGEAAIPSGRNFIAIA